MFFAAYIFNPPVRSVRGHFDCFIARGAAVAADQTDNVSFIANTAGLGVGEIINTGCWKLY